ncbi:unnamed protein product [Cyprideis torosa]|uniref:BBSome complex member BBS5 PH domain-containing protein n=1 Tax=Cyprideis torosa TaxID=163714 RepID=A0A7R8WDH4_9CRUS|nr:unnamed protein product [Cyprideis torosa]CAG0888366.1 unnamed protein product [Cyprideis torosa]
MWSDDEDEIFWEDKDVRFDVSPKDLQLRPGEEMLEKLEHIEDTKGNSGEKGILIISNLRIMWRSVTHPKINLSIGLNTLLSITTKTVNSKLRGITEALHLLTKVGNVRFEFIFTTIWPADARLIACVTDIHKAFVASRAYRDLKLRTSLFHNRQLKLLRKEEILDKISGVWNLSSDQGNLGILIITNIRIIWYSATNEQFNLSLPYLQLANVTTKNSQRFGPALVLECAASSGGYVLGFRVDPEEKRKEVLQQIKALWDVALSNPVFGVQYTPVQGIPGFPKGNESIASSSVVDWEEVDEATPVAQDAYAVYYADGSGHTMDRPPVYDEALGLAFESLKDGFTLDSLWEVHVCPLKKMPGQPVKANFPSNDDAVLEAIFNPFAPLGEVLPPETEGLVEETVNENDPSTPLQLAAIQAAEEGRTAEAEVLIGQAISESPSRAALYNDRAQMKQLRGDLQGALDDLDVALRLSEEHGRVAAQAYSQKGCILRRQGDQEGARKCFEEGAKRGNRFARMQAVQMNPYAAMCNKMLHDVMECLREGRDPSGNANGVH